MINVSYVTTLPLIGNAPKILSNDDLLVRFFNHTTGELVAEKEIKDGVACGERQWYTNWRICCYKGNELIFEDIFNPVRKPIFIKMDAFALGDNIAWMPYVEEFRKKYQCQVICSTFFNDLFESVYPEILFVVPNTRVANVYSQIYIGTANEINPYYSPSCYLNTPLQKIATDILGLEYHEIPPRIAIPPHNSRRAQKYVCLSEYTSLRVKDWNVPGGWQAIVDFYKDCGYEVVVISKEYSYLKGVINKSGPSDLADRIVDLLYADYFIGSSSGLSWLAWAIGKHVVLISDFTPPYHEFQSNVTRIYNPKYKRDQIVYEEVKEPVSTEYVLSILRQQI